MYAILCVCVYMCIHIYIYIYIYRERERKILRCIDLFDVTSRTQVRRHVKIIRQSLANRNVLLLTIAIINNSYY